MVLLLFSRTSQLYRNAAELALVLRWYCARADLVLHSYCTYAVLALQSYCASVVLLLHSVCLLWCCVWYRMARNFTWVSFWGPFRSGAAYMHPMCCSCAPSRRVISTCCGQIQPNVEHRRIWSNFVDMGPDVHRAEFRRTSPKFGRCWLNSGKVRSCPADYYQIRPNWAQVGRSWATSVQTRPKSGQHC